MPTAVPLCLQERSLFWPWAGCAAPVSVLSPSVSQVPRPGDPAPPPTSVWLCSAPLTPPQPAIVQGGSLPGCPRWLCSELDGNDAVWATGHTPEGDRGRVPQHLLANTKSVCCRWHLASGQAAKRRAGAKGGGACPLAWIQS